MGAEKGYSGLFHETGPEYNDEFKAKLDRRYGEYKNGKAEMITAEESKRRIEEILTQVKVKAS